MTRKPFTLLFAFAAALRIFLIWNPPLWYDENFSLLVARLPIDRFWLAILGDVHPPLYYLAIRPIAILFSQPWAIRIPSVIFSLIALWLAWKLFDEMQIPPLVSSAALVLIAVMPVQLWFAQEARMYALLEMLVLMALLFGHRRQWFQFTLALIAMCYTQNYGPFYAVVITTYLLIRDPKDVFDLLRSGAWTVLAWVPWYGVMRSQMSNISESYWIQITFTGPGTIISVLQQLFFMSILPLPLFIPAIVILFVALLAGTWAILRQRWGILLLAFGPLLIAVIASLVWQPVLLFRPLIGTTPFLYLIVCWPLNNFPTFKPFNFQTRSVLYLSIFILPLIVSGTRAFYSYAPLLKGLPFTDALNYVQSHWQPGDAIYYTDDGPMVNAVPYVGDKPQYQMPICDKVYGNLSDQTRKAIGIPQTDVANINAQRIWIFAPVSSLHPDCYLKQLQPLTIGAPVVKVDDNQYISSGVWLEEK